MDVSTEDALTLIGHVVVVVRLHPLDIVHEEPAPLTFSLPRTTLLLSVLQAARWHFARYTVSSEVDPQRTQLWFAVKMHPYEHVDELVHLWRQSHPSSPRSVDASSRPLRRSSASGDYPVSWLLPVGAIKDFATEVRRRAAWLHSHAPIDPAVDGRDATPQRVSRLGELSGPMSTQTSVPPAASTSDAFDAFPLELYFHFHQCASAQTVDPLLPLYLHDDALRSGRYLIHETRRVHKYVYTALYGHTGQLTKLPPEEAEVLLHFAHLGAPSAFGHATAPSELGAAADGRAGTGGGGDREDIDESIFEADGNFRGIASQRVHTQTRTTHVLTRYHSIFVKFRRALQRGEQKNAYVAFAFPLDAMVTAILSHTVNAADQREESNDDKMRANSAAGKAMTSAHGTTQGDAEVKAAAATTDPTTEVAQPAKKTKRRKERSTRASAPVDVPVTPTPSTSLSTPALFEALVVPLTALAASSAAEVPALAATKLSFGHVLWRLFRTPCLSRRSSLCAPRTMMDVLLCALTPYYHDGNHTDHVEGTHGGHEVPEVEGCARFCADYEREPRGVKLAQGMRDTAAMADADVMSAPSREAHNVATSADGDDHGTKPNTDDANTYHAHTLIAHIAVASNVLFMVQGVCPSLNTPLCFMDEYLTSSNRTLYITAKVVADC